MSTFIVAEAACAHGGDFNAALRMVDVAKDAGCDAVKFQIFQAELIPQVRDDLIPFLKRCEWSDQQWQQLRDYCQKRGIVFMATPFDMPSVDRLCALGVDIIKVPSGRLTDLPFMQHVCSKGKRVIASTGMMELAEARWAHRAFRPITLLLCTSAYPCPLNAVNLNVLKMKTFSGLSDHTRSTVIPAAAVALGAQIIEKHFTLSRSYPGPDQAVSLEPEELREMVKNIREVEAALGDGRKKVEDAEAETLHRKVVHGAIASSVAESDSVGGSEPLDGTGETAD